MINATNLTRRFARHSVARKLNHRNSCQAIHAAQSVIEDIFAGVAVGRCDGGAGTSVALAFAAPFGIPILPRPERNASHDRLGNGLPLVQPLVRQLRNCGYG